MYRGCSQLQNGVDLGGAMHWLRYLRQGALRSMAPTLPLHPSPIPLGRAGHVNVVVYDTALECAKFDWWGRVVSAGTPLGDGSYPISAGCMPQSAACLSKAFVR